MKSKAGSRIARIFFPQKCTVCGRIVPIEQEYCSCFSDGIFPLPEEVCLHCGYSLQQCQCEDEAEITFENFAAVYIYSGKIRARIHNLKFHGAKYEADAFGEEMSFRFAQCFPNVTADAVTFVPMSKNEEKERRYNQSELLARAVAKSLFIPCRRLLLKTKDTQSQHTLSKDERRKNLGGAFCANAKEDIKGKTVILCDDIKTTGTTLKRCCDVLYENGAKEVYCLCIAVSESTKIVF